MKEKEYFQNLYKIRVCILKENVEHGREKIMCNTYSNTTSPNGITKVVINE